MFSWDLEALCLKEALGHSVPGDILSLPVLMAAGGYAFRQFCLVAAMGGGITDARFVAGILALVAQDRASDIIHYATHAFPLVESEEEGPWEGGEAEVPSFALETVR